MSDLKDVAGVWVAPDGTQWTLVREGEWMHSWYLRDTAWWLGVTFGGIHKAILHPDLRACLGKTLPPVPKRYSVPVKTPSGAVRAWANGALYEWTYRWEMCRYFTRSDILAAAQAIRQAGPDGLPPAPDGAVPYREETHE